MSDEDGGPERVPDGPRGGPREVDPRSGDAPAPARPRLVGRYVLLDEIASGGMATVHVGRLAGPAGFSRTVAIKQLHPQLARDTEFVKMFLDEARLAGRIQHPNVVPVLDVEVIAGEIYLVLEYVAGEALSRLRRVAERSGRPVPVPIALAILVDVLYGLHAAHEACDDGGQRLGIVHRDVSPHNVLVGGDGVARILDFGVAKAMGRMQVTRQDQLKGKLAYMAPEQLAQGDVDRRADVYAASIVLWEILTARRLFQADDEVTTFRRALEGNVSPPGAIVPGLPAALDPIVMKGLARERDDRFATAKEMAGALESLGARATPQAVSDWIFSLVGDELRQRARQIAAADNVVAAAAAPDDASALLSEPATSLVSASRVFAQPPASEPDPEISVTSAATPRALATRRLTIPFVVGAATAFAAAAVLVPWRPGRVPPEAITVANDPYSAPYGLAADDESLYWASYRDGTIRKMAKHGVRGAQYIVARNLGGPRFLAVDDRHVYWSNYTGGSVMRADKRGNPAEPTSPGEAEVLATGLREPWDVALDATAAYFTVRGDGAVLAIDKRRPGAPRVVASAQRVPSGIALDDGHVYWTTLEGGTIARASKAGGPASVLAERLRGPDALALDDEFVYVSEWDGGTISRVPKSGGSPLALATGLRHPNGVAVDREHVYWSTASNQGIVARTPKRGGATAILAHRQAGPVRVLVDHDHVWWSLEYERSVVRLGR